MKNYTDPQIVDYGSIAEMTAGRNLHKYADAVHVTGSNLETESTGPCLRGFHESPAGSGHCVL